MIEAISPDFKIMLPIGNNPVNMGNAVFGQVLRCALAHPDEIVFIAARDPQEFQHFFCLLRIGDQF